MSKKLGNIIFIVLGIILILIIVQIIWICPCNTTKSIPDNCKLIVSKDILILDSVYFKTLDSSISLIKNKIKDFEYYIDKQSKGCDSLATEKWIISILIPLIGLIGVIIGLWATLGLKYSYEEKVKAFEKESNDHAESLKKESEAQISNIKKDLKLKTETTVSDFISTIENEISEAKNNLNQQLIESKLNMIYQAGVRDFNNREFKMAIPNFITAYKSDYRIESTCYYLGVCYKNIGDYRTALDYISEALTKNEKPSLIKEIQKEVDDIKKLTKEKEKPKSD
jgi:gas vesicle protein